MVFEPTSNQNLYSPHYSAILRVYDLTSERRNILFGFPSSSEKKNFFFNTKWKFSLLKIVCSTVLRLLCSYRHYKHYELINFKLQQCNYKHYKRVWLRSPFCSSFLFSPKSFFGESTFCSSFLLSKNWDETKMCWASNKSSNYKLHATFSAPGRRRACRRRKLFSSSKRRQGRPQTERSVSNTLQTASFESSRVFKFKQRVSALKGEQKSALSLSFYWREEKQLFFGARTMVSAPPPPSLSQGKKKISASLLQLFSSTFRRARRREGNGYLSTAWVTTTRG